MPQTALVGICGYEIHLRDTRTAVSRIRICECSDSITLLELLSCDCERRRLLDGETEPCNKELDNVIALDRVILLCRKKDISLNRPAPKYEKGRGVGRKQIRRVAKRLDLAPSTSA